MFDILRTRKLHGRQTAAFPMAPPTMPERFRGRPTIDASRCPEGCAECLEACAVNAISIEAKVPRIDLGRCTFCNDCVAACPEGAITFTKDYRLSTRKREDLVTEGEELRLAEALEKKSRALFGRSLKLRQVSAGGCNGCEAEVNAMSNVVFDLGRFGIQIVASPRHADGLLITGPIPLNMRLAVEKTYAAVPTPKLVIAVGACAISGGLFQGHPEVKDGVAAMLPVDLYIAGCPPHPLTILDGLLRLLGKLPEQAQGPR